MKKYFLIFVNFVFLTFTVFSVDFSSLEVNRKTALRCLKIAENYLSSKDFGSALNQTELGLSYDETVADLWYVKAVSSLSLGENRAQVLKMISNAFNNGEWLGYNRDNARILYADLLCDTGAYTDAMNILDAKPFLYSADSEYIRLKCLYRSLDLQNIQKAREKVDSAKRIYPNDKRFPLIFFKYEYKLKNQNTEPENQLVQKIADSFILKMPEYTNPDSELEIYASTFLNGEKQKRFLKSFSSRGLIHPLYAILAAKTGLLSEQEGFDYLCNFSDKEIEFSFLNDFVSLVTEKNVLQSVSEYFNSFSGTLLFDTNFSLEPNLKIKYDRGRSSHLTFDSQNDGIVDLETTFDFGEPLSHSFKNNFLLEYSSFPYVYKITENQNDAQNQKEIYFVQNEFSYSPLEIKEFALLKEKTGLSFFIPFVNQEFLPPVFDDYKFYVSKVVLPSFERENSFTTLNFLHGVLQSAQYFQNEQCYASSVFMEDGSASRKIDNTGDGIFEVTEFYEKSNENQKESEEISQKLTSNFIPLGLKLKMIQIDTNGDSIPDFSEEYFKNGSKVTMWDKNFDGNWEIRYKKYEQSSLDEPLIEESSFYVPSTEKIVSIRFENSVPVKVLEGENQISVTPGKQKSFYWIGELGTFDEEDFIFQKKESFVQGKCEIIQTERHRISVILILDKIFAEIILPVEG